MTPNLIVSGADDPATMSFRDTTSQAAPLNDSQRFSAEWDAANQRYRAGINAGYDEDEAAALYLTPVRDKYEVLKDVPEAMKPAAAKELDAAQVGYVQGVNSGYKPQDAAKIFLQPAQQKWVASADLPKSKKLTLLQQFAASPEHQYEAQQDETSALADIANGVDVRKTIEKFPLLLSMPGYSTRWNARYNSALNHDQSQAAAALKEKTAAEKADAALPDKLLSEAGKLFKLEVPPELAAAKSNRLAQVSSQLTNRPPAAVFTPPPAMTKPQKVSMAQQISEQHPDWTKEQVILAVQGKLKGAE